MPAIPESTRNSIRLRLLTHAEQNWPQLATVEVTYRSLFAYLTGILHNSDRIPLCRLRYGGSAHSLGFAIYSAAHEGYHEPPCCPGSPPAAPRRPRHRLYHPPRQHQPVTSPPHIHGPLTNPQRTSGADHGRQPLPRALDPLR